MKSELNRRTFLKKTGGFVLAGGTLEMLLAACGGNVATPTVASSPGAKKIGSAGLLIPGQLQWGATSNGGAPYVFPDPTNPNQLVGFEYEIGQELAALMGVVSKQVEQDYGQMEQALQANKFDMVMNGWEKTDDRLKTELFSQAYYRYGQQIVVRADDSRFSSMTTSSDLSLKDLENLHVGTGAGYKAADVMGTDKAIIVKLYDPDLPFNDLAAHRIDAVLIDGPIAAYYVVGAGPGGKPDPRLKLIGKPLATDDYFIGFNKANPNATTLLGEIDQALTVLKQNGTLKRIYTKWSMWNDQQAEIGTK
ncbi:MAG TPA: transporter substrate-binding domain-containing protein [Ktedonobacteraceae bacterium]